MTTSQLFNLTLSLGHLNSYSIPERCPCFHAFKKKMPDLHGTRKTAHNSQN